MTTLYTINNLSDEINADLLNNSQYAYCKELQGNIDTIRTIEEQITLTINFYNKYKLINNNATIVISFPVNWVNNLDNIYQYLEQIKPIVNNYLIRFDGLQNIEIIKKLQFIFNNSKSLFLV
jgi:hypothetical protein